MVTLNTQAFTRSRRAQALEDSEVLATLVQGLCVLENCAQKDDQQAAAGDLLRIARAAGFMTRGFTCPRVWSENWAKTYQPTRIVKAGDQVRVDKYPVIRNGEVLRRGVVCVDRFRRPDAPVPCGSRLREGKDALLAPSAPTPV